MNMDLGNVGCGLNVTQDRVQWWPFVNIVIESGFHKSEYHNQLSNYQLFKEDYVPCKSVDSLSLCICNHCHWRQLPVI